MATSAEIATIKNNIVRQSLAFQRDDDEARDAEGYKTQQARNLQNKVLEMTKGRTTAVRGGPGDGVRNVPTLGTGVGGGHDSAYQKRPRRQLCHRIVTPANQAVG